MKRNILVIVLIVLGVVVMVGGGVIAYQKMWSVQKQNEQKADQSNPHYLEVGKQIGEWLWLQKDEYYLATDYSTCNAADNCVPHLEGTKAEGVIRSDYVETIPVIWGYYKYFERTGDELMKSRAKSMLSSLFYNVASDSAQVLQVSDFDCELLEEVALSFKMDPESRQMATHICAGGTTQSSEVNNANSDLVEAYRRVKEGSIIDKQALNQRWQAAQNQDQRDTFEQAMLMGLLAIDVEALAQEEKIPLPVVID